MPFLTETLYQNLAVNAYPAGSVPASVHLCPYPVADETLRKDEAHVAIVAGGRRHEVHIAHASGTAENPMSDAQIEAKFLANATPVIGAGNAQRAVEWIASLEKQTDVRNLIALLA